MSYKRKAGEEERAKNLKFKEGGDGEVELERIGGRRIDEAEIK